MLGDGSHIYAFKALCMLCRARMNRRISSSDENTAHYIVAGGAFVLSHLFSFGNATYSGCGKARLPLLSVPGTN